MGKQLELKIKGMTLAAKANEQWLTKARKVAFELGGDGSFVSINNIRDVIEIPSGNWIGNIFQSKYWERVGYEPATHEKSHGRIVSIWILR